MSQMTWLLVAGLAWTLALVILLAVYRDADEEDDVTTIDEVVRNVYLA